MVVEVDEPSFLDGADGARRSIRAAWRKVHGRDLDHR
jgi:hypothetical protein